MTEISYPISRIIGTLVDVVGIDRVCRVLGVEPADLRTCVLYPVGIQVGTDEAVERVRRLVEAFLATAQGLAASKAAKEMIELDAELQEVARSFMRTPEQAAAAREADEKHLRETFGDGFPCPPPGTFVKL